MQTLRSDTIGGRGVTFVPPSGKYDGVVIWMHGLGDTAEGWAYSMPGLNLPNVKFILPTATNVPITINNGHSMPGWSDILGLDSNAPEDRKGFDASAARINRIIQQELDGGVPASKIVVAGFSQGGALALHVALRSQHSLGGCVALSTWVPLHADFPAALSPAAAHLKILQVHGDDDTVVGYSWGKQAHQLLASTITTPPPKFITIEGMGHSSDPDEMAAVADFLKSIINA